MPEPPLIDPRAQAFGNIADSYELGRKPYPPEPIERAYADLGLDGSSTVLDLAAGTGKLSRILQPLAGRLIAVEPLAEMARVLAEIVPGAELEVGTAEDIPLETDAVDGVFVGAAFHWFDAQRALPEIHRVLRPGGGLAIVYARRDWDEVPWGDELEELLAPLRNRTRSRSQARSWRGSLDQSPLFGSVVLEETSMTMSYTVEEYRNMMGSYSFTGALEPEQREATLDRIEQMARAHGDGPYAIPGRVEIYLTRARSRA